MSKTKKRFTFAASVVIGLIACFGLVFGLAACGTTSTEGNYGVTFYSDGASVFTTALPAGSTVPFPQNPIKKSDDEYDYAFLGWSLSNEKTILDEAEGFEPLKSYVMGEANVSFYAVYLRTPKEEVVYFTVTFYDGLTREMIWRTQVQSGKAAPEPERSLIKEHEGYTFSGWDRSLSKVTSRLDVYSQYNKNQYRLTRHVLGVEDETMAEYQSAVSLSAPEGQNAIFLFKGWYYDAALHQPVGSGSTIEMPARALDLYASYQIDMRSAELEKSGDFVYGKESTLSVTGLSELDSLAYTIVWEINDETVRSNTVTLRSAGEYHGSAQITANYRNGACVDTFTLALNDVSVEKATLTPSIKGGAGRIEYGVRPSMSLDYTNAGFQYNDGDTLPATLTPNFVFTNERGEACDGAKLGAGTYTVKAELADTDNYRIAPIATASLTVYKKTITLKPKLDSSALVYGNELRVTLSGTEGLVYGERSDEIFGEIAFKFRDKQGSDYTPNNGRFDAGDYTVSIANSPSADNYEVNTEMLSFTVAPRSLAITLSANSVSYGEDPQCKYTTSGLAADDSAERFSLRYEYQRDGEPYMHSEGFFPVGNYTVTVKVGKEDPNYEITVNETTFGVSKAELTLSAKLDASAGELVYGDTSNLLSKLTPDAQGLAEGEKLSEVVVGTSFVFRKNGAIYENTAQFAAGEYTVEVTGGTAENYEIRYAEALSFTVKKATLTGTIHLGQEQYVYGDVPKGTVEDLSGFKYGESASTVEITVVIRSGGVQATVYNAGDYVAVAQTNAENYTLSVTDKRFSIAKKELNVTFACNFTGAQEYGFVPVVTAQYSGFAGEENESVLGKDVRITYLSAVDQTGKSGQKLEVGSYTLQLSGVENQNYLIQQENKTLEITKRSLSVSVQGGSDSYFYGDDVTYEVQFGQMAFGETPEGVFGAKAGWISYTLDGRKREVDEKKPFETGRWNYVVLEGISPKNYEISLTDGEGSFEVSKRAFVVCPAKATINIEKGWRYQPSFAFDAALEALFRFEGALTFEAGTGTGTYSCEGAALNKPFKWEEGAFSIVLVADGTDVSEFFDVSYDIAGVTLSEYQFEISADDQTLPYDGNEHTFMVTAQVLQDDASSEAKVRYRYNDEAYREEPYGFTHAGTYVVEYEVSADNAGSVTGNFKVTITKAKNAIDFSPLGDMVYTFDGVTHTYDFALARVTFGKVTSIECGTLSKNNLQVETSHYGEHTVRVIVEGTEDYEGIDQTVQLKVNKAEYEVTSEGVDTTYDGEKHVGRVDVTAPLGGGGYTLTYSYDGYEGPNAPEGYVKAGSYTVSWTVSGNGDYVDREGSYTVVIGKATIGVALSEENRKSTYDKTKKGTGALVVTGVDGGEAPAVRYSLTNDGNYTLENAPVFIDAGSYDVYYEAKGENYETKRGSYTVEIEKRTLTVTAPDKLDREYDGKPYGKGLTIAGAVEGDTDGYSITYNYPSEDDPGTTKTESVAPTYAQAGTYTISYTVDGKKNYKVEDANAGRTYVIAIRKKKASLSLKSNATTQFTYDGTQHSVPLRGLLDYVGDYSAIKVSKTSGAGTLETSTFNYTFTTCAEGNATFRATMSEMRNYDHENVTCEITLTMAKGTHTGISAPSIPEQVMKIGKKLENIKLPEHYYWSALKTELKLNNAEGYDAYYNTDPDNYENFALKVQIKARKEKFTVTVGGEASETARGVALDSNGFTLTIRNEERNTISAGSPEYAYLNPKVTNPTDYNAGGTYLVTYDTGYQENDYFEIEGATVRYGYVKVTSVQINNAGSYTIEDALYAATNGNVVRIPEGKTSFMSASDRAKTGLYATADYYTVDSGVTLYLPYNNGSTDGYEWTQWKSGMQFASSQPGLCYSELIVGEGITLTNVGTITIGGILTGGAGGYYGAGQTAGGYGQITLGANTKIDSTGTINAYGFIRESTKDNGAQVNLNGGTMTEPFIVGEHRGGSVFYGMTNKNLLNPKLDGYTPFNRFYMENVSPQLTVKASAALKGLANLYASKSENTTTIGLFGASTESMIQLTGSSYAVLKYDTSTQIIKLKTYGDWKMNSLELTITQMRTVTLSMSDVMFPISWQYDIELNPLQGNGTATVDISKQDLKLFPGAKVTIGKGVTVNAKNIAIYDSSYVDPSQKDTNLNYPSGKGDAIITVNGTLNAAGIGGRVRAGSDGALLTLTATSVEVKELLNSTGSSFTTSNTAQTATLYFEGYNGSAWEQFTSGTYTATSGKWSK